MNLQLLARIVSEPWALRREHLAMFTQLIIAGEHPQRPPRSLTDAPPPQPAPSFRSPEASAKWHHEHAATHRKVWTWDGQIEIQAKPGYEIFNTEGWYASETDLLPVIPENVTVFLVWGILGRAWSAMDRWWLDAIDVDELAAAIQRTPEGTTVVLWFRSPGGISSGIPETAEILRKMGGKRRIVAFTDDLCASAAYWLAAQCESIHATPTADLGSIGVYIAFYDWTEYLTKAGIKLELFKAGEMKAMGMIGNPLNEAEREHLQARVAETYRAFTKDVTLMREIAPETMQGQTYTGAVAKKANLVDSFAPSATAFFASLK